MSTPDPYKFSRVLPCPECESESVRVAGIGQDGEWRIDLQCRECGAKVHAIGDQLFRTCADVLVIWNEQKRTKAA